MSFLASTLTGPLTAQLLQQVTRSFSSNELGRTTTTTTASPAERPAILQEVSRLEPSNHSQVLAKLGVEIITLPPVRKKIEELQKKYPDLIAKVRRQGTGWVEKKNLAKQSKTQEAFEKEWYQFREEVCAVFQTCANEALQAWGIRPIAWSKYGTDSAFSDIDLIALSPQGIEHTTEELFLAATIMNVLAAHVFAPNQETKRAYCPTTGYLFDWETYIPHHANHLGENNFHTSEYQALFKTLQLQLAVMQIHQNATPEMWVKVKEQFIKDAGTDTTTVESLQALFEDIEKFRALQKKHEEAFVETAAQGKQLDDNFHAELANIYTLKIGSLAAMEASECIRKCKALEQRLCREELSVADRQNIEREIDQERMRYLLLYALIESKQAGGQYSAAAYEVICKGHASQQHSQTIRKERKRLQEARHSRDFMETLPRIKAINEKHPTRPVWEHILSSVENFGFYTHEKEIIGGTKYLERVYHSLKILTEGETIPASMKSHILQIHDEATRLLSVKRDEKLHVDAMKITLERIEKQQKARHAHILDAIPKQKPEDLHGKCLDSVFMSYVNEAFRSAVSQDQDQLEVTQQLIEDIRKEVIWLDTWEEMRAVVTDYLGGKWQPNSLSMTAKRIVDLHDSIDLLPEEEHQIQTAAFGILGRSLSTYDHEVHHLIEALFAPKQVQSEHTHEMRRSSYQEIIASSTLVKRSIDEVRLTMLCDVSTVMVQAVQNGELPINSTPEKSMLTFSYQNLLFKNKLL